MVCLAFIDNEHYKGIFMLVSSIPHSLSTENKYTGTVERYVYPDGARDHDEKKKTQ